MTPEQFREFEENNRKRHEFAMRDNRLEHEANRFHIDELIISLEQRVCKIENWQTKVHGIAIGVLLFMGLKGSAH